MSLPNPTTMKLWNRASGALKDRTSLLKATLTPRSTLRNPGIETAVIKATTHDESTVDYRSTQNVFTWVRISDDCLYRVLWVLFRRMRRTHNWAVALKGLMLLHGVFSCKVPGIQQIGHLPPNLLNIKEKHIKNQHILGLTAFIYAYYAFLDNKSAFISLHSQERIKRASGDEINREEKQKLVLQDLVWLQKLQVLLDSLLRIQPKTSQTVVNMLVLEAMDCIMIEIYDIYSRIGIGIGTILLNIYPVGKTEAIIALPVLQKAKVQGEQVAMFFEFCRDIGVGNTSECPKMEQIPEAVIKELENIISGKTKQPVENFPKEEVKSVIVVTDQKLLKTHGHNDSVSSLKTVITDDWEVFEDKKKSSSAPLPDLISL